MSIPADWMLASALAPSACSCLHLPMVVSSASSSCWKKLAKRPAPRFLNTEENVLLPFQTLHSGVLFKTYPAGNNSRSEQAGRGKTGEREQLLICWYACLTLELWLRKALWPDGLFHISLHCRHLVSTGSVIAPQSSSPYSAASLCQILEFKKI